MNWHKITIRPSDRLMSKYVKERDKGLCTVNFKCYRGTPGTDNSHFQKRRKESVRHDPDNCDFVCRKCHYFIENDPIGQRTLEEWKLKQLGDKRYNALMIRANTTGRKDEAMAVLYIKELIKTL